jgi:hypothetical protein
MRVRVDEQLITYVPPVVEVLKFAWVQYFSIVAVLYVLASMLRALVYRNQLFSSRVQHSGQPVAKLHQF